jgi:hypothetical protein
MPNESLKTLNVKANTQEMLKKMITVEIKTNEMWKKEFF